MPAPESKPGELSGLDPSGVLRGALGEGSASWPVEGPVTWSPPAAGEVAALFPGFAEVTFIGRGGMGAVYAARQVSLERRVALKLLPAELSRDPAAADRFRREARALAKLSHPNIVAIHDFGETPDGAFFFVMEFVEGADLFRLIHEGQLPLPRALEVVRQVCDALEFAHTQGFVHRDIKPANILVDGQGRVKVSDFGLAKLMSESTGPPDEPPLSTTDHLVGTPEYVAPEQRRGDRLVDHRADIYSLGVMLYEMLTGSLPYGAFEPPSRRVGTGEALDRIVRRAMQEEPEKRYQHAADLKSEVTKAARPSQGRAWWIAAALCALVGAAAIGWSKRHHKAPAPTAVDPTPRQNSPFENSLGMKFVPAGTTGVLFSVWETRRRDFEAFASASGHQSSGNIELVRDGAWRSEHGSWREPPSLPPQTPEHPVVAVTQVEAEAFCAWLTASERTSGRLGPGAEYRLPTLPECSAAAGIPFEFVSLGPLPPPSGHPAGASEVGLSPAGSHGLHGLLGNVAEWTAAPGARPNQRLTCGRGWADTNPALPGPAITRSYDRNMRGIALGFRIVLDRSRSP